MRPAPRRSLISLAVFIGLTGAAQAAAWVGHERVTTAVRRAVAAPAAAWVRPEPAPVLTFAGEDLDGDGAADFANPTGEAPREHDGYGGGAFGASRDGGAREHAGVDYVAEAGQRVSAPISGFVTKIGRPYADGDLRYVEIRNPALNVSARVFYVDPTVEVGDAVRMGGRIGRAATLQHRYPGITDHVHLELREGGRTLDAETVIVARLETSARG